MKWERLFCIRPRKIWKNIRNELSWKFLYNIFPSCITVVFLRLGIDSVWKTASIRSPKSQKALGMFHSCKIHNFCRFFKQQLGPNVLRHGQCLYKAHIGHSRVSSIAFGLLHLQCPLPTSKSKNIFQFFPVPIQNRYRRNLGIILPYRNFSTQLQQLQRPSISTTLIKITATFSDSAISGKNWKGVAVFFINLVFEKGKIDVPTYRKNTY